MTSLAKQLLDAIKRSDLPVNRIAKATGIRQQVLQRFVAGDRDNIRIDTADKLAAFFGMRFTAPRRPKK